MTEYEMRELVNSGSVLIDATFETWMTATFAMILVAHVAGTRLNICLKGFLALMYLLVSAVLYFRYSDVVRGVEHTATQLAQFDGGPDPSLIGVVIVLRSLVFIVGATGAVMFLFVPSLHKQRI
jgi:hypothetical protein